MKIGIQANLLDKKGYGRWGEETYKKLKEHGFMCSDFDMSVTDSIIYTSSEMQADEILIYEKNLASDAGIEISQVHGPWRWPPRDYEKSDREERMESMKRSIRFTSVLGCKNWVVHPIMPFGIEDIGTPNEKNTWDMNLEFMTELLKTAKEYGVTICLENMPMLKFSLAKPADILRFVQTIDDENFKICFDTGHAAVFEYESLIVEDEIRRLGDQIKTLHVHDTMYACDLHLMPYSGVIDWKKFKQALDDIGFDGVFSLEVLPSRKLPDSIFDGIGRHIYKIAEDIVGKKGF